jgi:two-component SAPR family response regulator
MKVVGVFVPAFSLRRFINNHQNLHLIGDFSNTIEARSCMSIHNVDLVFLDIEMPVNGFDFLDGQSKTSNYFHNLKSWYAMKAF